MSIIPVAKENVSGIVFSCLLIQREPQHMSLAVLFGCWEPAAFLFERGTVHARLLRENRDKSQVPQCCLANMMYVV